MTLEHRHYGWMTVAVLAVEVALEAAHVATGHPWIGFGRAASVGLSAFAGAAWLVAALGVILHRRWASGFAIVGALWSILHGLLVVTGGDRFGVLYFAAGSALVFLVKRAWFTDIWEPALSH